MKTIKILCGFWCVLNLFSSCNQNKLKGSNIKNGSTNETNSMNNNFDDYLLNFKSIEISNLSNLRNIFNEHYLANEDSLVEVSSKYKNIFLKSVKADFAYYGFQTKLPNKSFILTYLIHCGNEINDINEEIIDTTFLNSFIYNDKGNLISSIKIFGSNLTGIPPTYNMVSTFSISNDSLVINNYEYSTGKDYSSVITVPGSDSILVANLTISKYRLNLHTNAFSLITRNKQKAKVIEVYQNPLPVYLKLLVPEVD